VLCYRELARRMRGRRPFYGVQAPSLYGGDEPDAMEEKAELYVKAIRAVQPHGPYFVGGHSYGGNVALEVASQLADLREEVSLVALIDSHPPSVYRRFPTDDELRSAFPPIAAAYLGLDLAPERLAMPAPIDPLDRLVGALRSLYPETNAGWVEHFYAVWAAHLQALHRYQPRRPYPGVLTYFRARTRSPLAVFHVDGVDLNRAWASLSKQALVVNEMEGDHFSIIRPPYVEKVAATLRACIESARIGGIPVS
jgi:thioesterase domain-containing protein